MLVAFVRYSRDGSFAVLGVNRPGHGRGLLGIDGLVLTYASEHWIDPWHEDGVQYWEVGMHVKQDVGPGTCFGSIRICVADMYRVANIVDSFDTSAQTSTLLVKPSMTSRSVTCATTCATVLPCTGRRASSTRSSSTAACETKASACTSPGWPWTT